MVKTLSKKPSKEKSCGWKLRIVINFKQLDHSILCKQRSTKGEVGIYPAIDVLKFDILFPRSYKIKNFVFRKKKYYAVSVTLAII